MDKIELTSTEHDLAQKIAAKDNINVREAISKSIYFLAHRVDYTLNVKDKE